MRVVRECGLARLILALLLIVAAALLRPSLLSAQSPRGLAGTVLDPDGQVVVNASIVIRNETSGELRTATTDGSGRFSAANLPVGAYVVEVFVPGFETVRRTGIQVTDGATASVSIQLIVANISEMVTVSAALLAAAVAAPSQASITARSPQSLISNEYIRNYTSPVSDYSQVLQMALSKTANTGERCPIRDLR